MNNGGGDGLFSRKILAGADRLLQSCRQHGVMLVTAESCTGGMIGAALTSLAGSSDVVAGGFITYSNTAKTDMIGVPADLIHRHGAVSRPVALAMAEGALSTAQAAGLAIAVTGVAGPGASAHKPAGLVLIAVARRPHAAQVREYHFTGDRQGVRLAALDAALGFAHDVMATGDNSDSSSNSNSDD